MDRVVPFSDNLWLSRAFNPVQIGLSLLFCIAWPQGTPVMGTSSFILLVHLLAREAVEIMPDKNRARGCFGWIWFAAMTCWLPVSFATRSGAIVVEVPSVAYGWGATMWVLFVFFQGIMRIPTRARIATNAWPFVLRLR